MNIDITKLKVRYVDQEKVKASLNLPGTYWSR